MKEVNLLLDTSASMAYDDIKQIINFVFESFDTINLIHFDSEVNKIEKLEKNNWKLHIINSGGTILQKAFDYLSENKDIANLDTYIYSDGYTDIATLYSYPENLIHLRPHLNSKQLDIKISNFTEFKEIKI